jgi:hypothetical protein
MNFDLLSDDEEIIAAFGDREKCDANLKQFLAGDGRDLSEEDAQSIAKEIWAIHAIALEMKNARGRLMVMPSSLLVH